MRLPWAECLIDNGRTDEAIQAYRWACGLMPQDVRYRAQLVRLEGKKIERFMAIQEVILLNRSNRQRILARAGINQLRTGTIVNAASAKGRVCTRCSTARFASALTADRHETQPSVCKVLDMLLGVDVQNAVHGVNDLGVRECLPRTIPGKNKEERSCIIRRLGTSSLDILLGTDGVDVLSDNNLFGIQLDSMRRPLMVYTSNNPVNRVDPSGLDWLDDITNNRFYKWLYAGDADIDDRAFRACCEAAGDYVTCHINCMTDVNKQLVALAGMSGAAAANARDVLPFPKWLARFLKFRVSGKNPWTSIARLKSTSPQRFCIPRADRKVWRDLANQIKGRPGFPGTQVREILRRGARGGIAAAAVLELLMAIYCMEKCDPNVGAGGGGGARVLPPVDEGPEIDGGVDGGRFVPF